MFLVVLKACVPKLCVQLYSCYPVWQLVRCSLVAFVNIVIKDYYYYNAVKGKCNYYKCMCICCSLNIF